MLYKERLGPDWLPLGNRLRFLSSLGGKIEGQTFGIATTSPPKLNLLRLEEEISQAHLRLARTYIERLEMTYPRYAWFLMG